MAQTPRASFRIPSRLLTVLDELAEQEARTRSAMIAVLLRDALERRGLWPPRGE